MTHRDTWQRTVDRLLFDPNAPWDASASMTMHLYGHLITQNPWDADAKFGGTTGARTPGSSGNEEAPGSTSGV